MKRYGTILALCMCTLLLVAQTDKVFTVLAPKEISLTPAMDKLVGGDTYYFRLTGLATKDITRAIFNGGTVTTTDTGICIKVSPITTSNAKGLLVLYVKNGSQLQAKFERVFEIVKQLDRPEFAPRFNQTGAPPISIYWGNTVSLDLIDTITKNALLQQSAGSLSAFNWNNYNGSYNILSFKMKIVCENVEQKFAANDDHVSGEMQDAIENATSGCKLTLYDIRYMPTTTSPDELVAPVYTLLIQ